MEIPKHQIDWLMGRMHVYTPDAEIKADIRKRAESAVPPWPEDKIVEAENYAVESMEANRQLCRDLRL